MHLAHGQGFLFKNHLLSVCFPFTPLCFHLLDALRHLLLSDRPLVYLLYFLLQTIIQLAYMTLGTINISLVISLELKYLLFKLEVQLVDMVQFTVFFLQAFAVLL